MAATFNPFTGTFDFKGSGGGTVTVPGSDTQVIFNDGGSLGADAYFTWDKTNNILYLGAEAVVGTISGKNATSTNVAGGGITIYGGNGNGNGSGGDIRIEPGNSGITGGTGGAIKLFAGDGSAGNANGGSVQLAGGPKSGSGAAGTVDVASGGAAGYAKLSTTNLSGDRLFQFPDTAGTLAIVPGSDTQVIFNDGGALGADAGLTYNKTTNTLTVEDISGVAGTNLTITKPNADTGVNINVTAGSVLTGDNGGSVILTGGASSYPAPGASIEIAGGDTDNGGSIILTAGNGVDEGGNGGNIYFDAGNGTNDQGRSYFRAYNSTPLWMTDRNGGTAILDIGNIGTGLQKTYYFPNVSGTFILGSVGGDTQIMFNDGGSLIAGDAGLTWNKTLNELTITPGSQQQINIPSTATGSLVGIKVGDQTVTNAAGSDFQINGGYGNGTAQGGDIDLIPGGNLATGAGGHTHIYGGEAAAADAGSVYIIPGKSSGAGAQGRLYIKDPVSNIYAKLETGNLATADKTFTFPNVSGTFALLEAANAFSTNNTIAGYLRIGSNTAPANTTAGDLTAIRLSLNNVAFSGTAGRFLNAGGVITAINSTEYAWFIQPSVTPASTSSAGVRTLGFDAIWDPTTGINQTGALVGGFFQWRLRGDGTNAQVIGVSATGVVLDGSSAATVGQVTLAQCFNALPYSRAAGTPVVTIVTAIGYDVSAVTTAGLTCTNLIGCRVNDSTNGTITNQYGIQIVSLKRHTTDLWGIQVAFPAIQGSQAGTTNLIGIGLPTASAVLGNTTGTTAMVAGIYIGIPTYTSNTNTRTVTIMAGLYIAGAPVASTNVTVSAGGGPYALFVDGGTSRFDGNLDFSTADTTNLVLGTGTGTKIGTATNQKLGFFNAAPVIQPSAYTQTYSTADKTHANFTSADLATTAATQTTPWGFGTQAQADDIATQFNLLRADVADLKQLVNSVIDDLQSLGLVG